MRFAFFLRTCLPLAVLLARAGVAGAQNEPRPSRGGPAYPVEIDSSPQQAAIYLEDEKYGVVGYTPWKGKLEEGSWTVILKKDGYQPVTRVITVRAASQVQETFIPMARTPEPPPAPPAAPPPPAGGGGAAGGGGQAPGQGDAAGPPAAADRAAGAGGLRFVSKPGGATVLLDGEEIGQTPMVAESVPAGEHVVSIQAEGYHAFENGVTVKAGEVQLVKADLQKEELSEEEKALEQRGLTTFGARALPAGRSTMALGVGYPYFLNARFMVGVGRLSEQVQFDAGAHFRTYGARWELSAVGRATLFDNGPFAFGAFVDTGGGSTYFDNSKRDNFFFNGGLMASLTGLGAATLTGRAYLNAWTDRHCPAREGGDLEVADGDAADVCVDYLRDRLRPEDRDRVDRLVGRGNLFDRDSGARLMTSLAVEVALSDASSFWVLLEGAPRQDERAAYTDLFHAWMVKRDPRTYATAGFTMKF
ncbi:MAG TPA: PEGA domain-containing protein [Kofleriaceae bacterium]|nr:PEGA domain-containing protein [Kofleriaceae bacterium]